MNKKFSSLSGAKSRNKIVSLLLLLALLLTFSGCDIPISDATPEIEIHFIDVGQADAALILCGGESMLIDGGNVADSSLIVAYLRDQDISELDYVVSTHAHEDHVGGLAGALAVFDVGAVFSPVDDYDTKAFTNFKKYATEQGLELTPPTVGDTLSLGGATVYFLGPVKDYDDPNDTSIVLLIEYEEIRFLFTGDATRESEGDILDNGADVSATVLKVGHHGSYTSNSYRWIYEVQPEYAVISVGQDNSYGHPHREVMSRLRDAEVTVLRTDMQGHIVCYSDGQTVWFVTERNADAETNP